MKARLLALLRAHWPLVLALAVGVGIGRFAHSVTTTRVVTESESAKATAAASGTTDSHLARGPVEVEVDVGGWAPPVLPVFPDAPQATPAPRARPGPPLTLGQLFPEAGPLAGVVLPPGSKLRIHEGPSTEDTHASTQSVATEETHRELKEVLAAPPRLSIFLGGQLRPDTRGAGGLIVRVLGPISASAILVPDLADPFHRSTVIVGAVVATPW